LRSSGGWTISVCKDIEREISHTFGRLEACLQALARVMPVCVASPSLPFLPVTYGPPVLCSDLELRLRVSLAEFLSRLCGVPGLRLVNESAVATNLPANARGDAGLELNAGFPYSLAYADLLAAALCDGLFPSTPRKGLITDLDDTLWKGILGEAGVAGVSWGLADHAQAHALYQQMLASLAETGVLLAIASKNDASLVQLALDRSDLMVSRNAFFPVEAHWSAKSTSVARILRAWNIAADSVVFVDDSPMELAEVAENYPGIRTLRFAPEGAAIVNLLRELRACFGKLELREEDRLRLDSLRRVAEFADEQKEASAGFLERLEATIRLDYSLGVEDARAFELINRTNQFNLNGRKWMEAEWRDFFRHPGAFLATASYVDRFGGLGKIAVIGGLQKGDDLEVLIWVMSCRAFSRQIEYQVLKRLFERTGVDSVRLAYEPTSRNGPMQDFLRGLMGGMSRDGKGLSVTREQFLRSCPQLHHRVSES